MLIFLTPVLFGVAQAQEKYERLDAFYADEFKQFNQVFEKHIEQLDKCLTEMDRFEAGEFLLEPMECPAFDKMRRRVSALLDDIKLVRASYRDWLIALQRADAPDTATQQSSLPSSETGVLIQIYKVKYKRAMLQSARVQKMQGELVKTLRNLTEHLQELTQDMEGEEKD